MSAMKQKLSGSVASYCIGFALSLLLTIASFGLAQLHVNSGHERFSHESLVAAVLVFAFTQLAVQIIFFLHLAREPRPRPMSMLFLFTGLIIAIVTLGSIWIMKNLDYTHAGSYPSDEEIIHDEGLSH